MYGYELFHEELMKPLIHAAQHNEAGHAYIFEGAPGLFKHNAAQLFAAALTCLSPASAPCGQCAACVKSKSGTNPDIIHVNSGSKKSISVDTIRGLLSDAYVKPFEANKKVYIIEDAPSMTEQAQNAFLKLLEEPPAYAVFILIASNSAMLLQTVLSRCSIIRFEPISDDAVRAYIRRAFPDETGRLELLVKYARGIPGALSDIIGDPDFEQLRTEALAKIPALFSKRLLSAYAISDFLEAHKDRAELILEFWLQFIRDVMLEQQGNSASILNVDKIDSIKSMAGSIDEKLVITALERILEAKSMLRKNVKLQALSHHMSFLIKKQLQS